MRSNVGCWKLLHDSGYFKHHRLYQDRDAANDYDLRQIGQFFDLKRTDTVVVIGCGYGRETAHIAPLVKRVYGIDVCNSLLNEARDYVRARGSRNFTAVLADEYAETIPKGIDLVYSLVTLQHLTRDLVNDYLSSLGEKLGPDGRMVLQFFESDGGQEDAELREYEPAVSWSRWQIIQAADHADLRLIDLVTDVHKDCLYHWAHLQKI